MNIENAKRAIAVMERIKHSDHEFDMTYWYGGAFGGPIPKSEEEALQCGTAACFLGWVALAPEIPELFVNGEDEIEHHETGECYIDALQEFMDISKNEAYALCGISLSTCVEEELGLPRYLDHGDPQPQDVIDVLQFLINKYEAQQ